MFRSTGWLASWLGGMAALVLIAGFPGQRASAQVCVEDQYGRVVCGRQVDPNRAAPGRVEPNRNAPRYQDAPPERYYGPPPGRESAAPPPRDYAPPSNRDYGPAPERDYGPPSGRESAAPPARDYAPPPRREYRGPPERDYGPPPERDPRNSDPRNSDPRNLGRLYQDNEPRYQPPMRGPNGQWSCPRDFAIQDGLCKPYIRR